MKKKPAKTIRVLLMCLGIILALNGLLSIDADRRIRILYIVVGTVLCLRFRNTSKDSQKTTNPAPTIDDKEVQYRKSVEQMRVGQRSHAQAAGDPLLNVASADDLIITTQNTLADFNRNYKVIDERRTKVVGVTFRNDDGSNRQSILANCHAGDEILLRYFEFRGAPAYAVHTQYGQIGNLSAELSAELDLYGDDIYVVGRILNITGGYQGLSFGCNIALTFYGPKHI